MNEPTNGNGLPPNRAAIAEANITAFNVEYQRLAADRDDLQAENNRLKSDLAALKAAAEAMASMHNLMESRVASMTATRDQAVKEVAEVKAVLRGMLALGRAFEIENEPLVRETAPVLGEQEVL